jgi:hypothetical protein
VASADESEKSRSSRWLCFFERLGESHVGRLDVAVGDARLFEVLHRREQVVAVAARELERQRALLAEDVAEAAIAGELEEQARQPAERDDVIQRDDVLVAQVAQRLRPRRAAARRSLRRAEP